MSAGRFAACLQRSEADRNGVGVGRDYAKAYEKTQRKYDTEIQYPRRYSTYRGKVTTSRAARSAGYKMTGRWIENEFDSDERFYDNSGALTPLSTTAERTWSSSW